MPERKRKQHLARVAATLATQLAEHWGRQPGEIGIGLVLSEAFYTSNSWVTVGYIKTRMGHSGDTLRRRLEGLIDRGLVEFTDVDGRRLYRATEPAAETTTDCIEDALIIQPPNGLTPVKLLGST